MKILSMNCNTKNCLAECCGTTPLAQSFKKYPFARKCEVMDFEDFLSQRTKI